MLFEPQAYRYHSCGCYRRGVTRIDGRGDDPCPKHAPAPGWFEKILRKLGLLEPEAKGEETE